jgi:hypothetical protein
MRESIAALQLPARGAALAAQRRPAFDPDGGAIPPTFTSDSSVAGREYPPRAAPRGCARTSAVRWLVALTLCGN